MKSKFITRAFLAVYALVLLSTSSLLPLTTKTASADGTNLVANPSVETAATTTTPTSWASDKWGTNTETFNYLSTGHTGSRSAQVKMTSYTSGDAKWYFAPVTAAANTSYSFSDYYQSTVATSVVAQLDDGAGNYTYVDLGTAAASTAWAQYTGTFSTTASTKNVTVFHVIAAVGTLTVDDYSLTAGTTTTPTPPTTPTSTITNPSVETAASTTAPQGWTTDKWGTNTATFNYLNTGNTGSRSVQVNMTSYTSGDAKWAFTPVTVTAGTNYTFSDYYQSTVATSVVAEVTSTTGALSYVNLAAAPASTAWKQYTGTFTAPTGAATVTIFHLISAVGTLTTDDFSFAKTAVVVTPTAPTVSVSAPTANASVSGAAVALAATATAQGGNTIKNVQFKIDGVAVGTADTTSPYSYSWNSTTVANGSHLVTATVTANDGQTATSAATTITVANPVSTNLVPNPSLETAATGSTTLPASWYQGGYGNNTATFAYNKTAAKSHTGTHSITTTVTNFVDGGANWSYDAPTVTPGKIYEFSNYYKSSVATQVIVAVKLADGTTQYVWLGNPFVSATTWTKFFATFTMPANAVSAVAYQGLISNGTFTADDFVFQPYTPTGFSKAMVTLTFDDGVATQYTNALPIMQKYGFNGTFYAISGDLDVCDPDVSSICYLTSGQLQALQASGQEIGSHTVSHPDLTTLSAANLTTELSKSQTDLKALLGTPISGLAAPYGSVNANVLTEAKKYYTSQRGTEAGYNSIDNYDQMDLLVQNVDTDITVAQVQSYIDYAKATNTWLILVFHDFSDDDNVDPGYNTTPAKFDAELAYLKASGVSVQTLAQALATVAPQITN